MLPKFGGSDLAERCGNLAALSQKYHRTQKAQVHFRH